MYRKNNYVVFRQLEDHDCGPTCLRMICAHYGKDYSLGELRDICDITRVGVSLHDLQRSARLLGFESVAVKLTQENLDANVPFPCILYWRQEHFVVLYRGPLSKDPFYIIADPAFGLIRLAPKEFLSSWKVEDDMGIALLMEPDENFVEKEPRSESNDKLDGGWNFLLKHALKYRWLLSKAAGLILLSSVVSWIMPILMQRIFDDGILSDNFTMVTYLLLAQLTLYIGDAIFAWIRGLLLIDVSMSVSIEIISSFIKKLVRIPLSYYDTKVFTDILQRVDDQVKIEEFISYKLISTVFSLVSIVVLSSLALYYNFHVYLIFLVGTILSIIWMLKYLRSRRYLDYTRFSLQSEEQSSMYEMIIGMAELKINNAADQKVDDWSYVQRKLHRHKISALNLNQKQLVGVNFITHVKNLLITGLCAWMVIHNKMSIGVMVSISYIIGQLTRPIDDLVLFVKSAQDARLALERMDEVHKRDDEHRGGLVVQLKGHIKLDDISFKYPGHSSPLVLRNLTLRIPLGKKTAIVGESGSGKTTLLKLLLRVYSPTSGKINVNDCNFNDVDVDKYRSSCGVVMQEGKIFSGTVTSNIAIGVKEPDMDSVREAARMACIDEFVSALPLGYETKIGKEGMELSGGQRQRILISRALYRDPDIIFLDEATSSLDASNERMIVDRMNNYLKGKTIIVVAHRLSTVQSADLIVVMSEGELVESGTHEELARKRGYYYQLVKNQLELGVE